MRYRPTSHKFTFWSPDRCIPGFYVCFCFKMAYLIVYCGFIMQIHGQQHCHAWWNKARLTDMFSLPGTSQPPCAENTRQQFSTTLGAVLNGGITNTKHKCEKWGTKQIVNTTLVDRVRADPQPQLGAYTMRDSKFSPLCACPQVPDA